MLHLRFLILLLLLPLAVQAARNGDAVVAVIDQTILTARDLDFAALEAALLDGISPEAPSDGVRREVFTLVLDEALLGRWAEIQLKSPTEDQREGWYREAAGRLEKEVGGADSLANLLEESSVDAREFRIWLKAQAAQRESTREAIRAFAQAGDPDLAVGKLSDAVRLRLAHVFISGRDATAEERVRLVHRNVEAGLAFGAAARLYSEDARTRGSEGELGWVTREEADEALWAAATASRFGSCTPPVATPGGWHLLRVLDYETPEQLRFRAALVEARLRKLRELREEADLRLAEGFVLEPLEAEKARVIDGARP